MLGFLHKYVFLSVFVDMLPVGVGATGIVHATDYFSRLIIAFMTVIYLYYRIKNEKNKK